MTELETAIRKAVIERVDRAPMAPSIESIDTLDRAALPAAHRHPRRGVLVGAGLVALLALVAGVLVTARLTQDPSQVSVDTTVVPPGKPAMPLAGRSLPARYGLPNGVPGYHFLTMELDRPVGLAPDDVAWLPTGPLGPLYAQSIRIDYDPTVFVPEDHDGIAVLTVLPEEQASVLAAASGGGPTHTATVGSRQVTVAEPWSASDERISDNRAATWLQDGVAIIVTGSPSVTEQQLLAAAGAVVPIPTIPLLPPVAPDAKDGGVVPAFYSLAPRSGPPDPNGPSADGMPWWALTNGEPLSAAMGTVLVAGTDGGDHYTVREIGDPMTGPTTNGAPGFATSTGDIPFGPTWMILNVGNTTPTLPNRFLVTGGTPNSVTSVQLELDDGTTLDGPTYDAGLGWPGRSFQLIVPDDRQVVHISARSSDGTLEYTHDLPLSDGSYPGKEHGYGLTDLSVCGEDPYPQFPTLDC